jgi:L-ascorbate metabolism protein UlaG (beta-lactamase superfamily)
MSADIDMEGRANQNEDISVPAEASGRITYLGHSTTLIELDGVRLLTDPILRARVAHLRRTSPAPEPGEVDAVLISHGHHDHLDARSLARLPRAVPVILPRGLGSLVRGRGFREVMEVDVGDETPIGDGVVVRTTPADHAGRPAPGRAALTVGFAVLGTRRVFFAGDTDVFPEMNGLVERLDLALLPIWGWGAKIGPGHMDPERAAEALTLLRPRTAIPIHWGTLRPLWRSSRARFLRDPPEAFAAAAHRLAPEVAVHVLEPGEGLDLG